MLRTIAGPIWFLVVAAGGALLIDHYLVLYPTIIGALLPLALVVMLVILALGRSLLSRALK